MDFGLSEEQILFKSTLRRFLADRCDGTRIRAIMESESGHDESLWRELANLGILGLLVPEHHGGAGLELLDLALAAEELGYGATPGPFLATSLATVALLESGNEEAQARWLPEIASGATVASVAIGEADCEWDPERLKTSVTDGRITGNKVVVPGARASSILLVAAIDRQGPGAWLVENGSPGLTITPRAGIDMTRHVDTVVFDETPATKLNTGRVALDRTRDAGLILLAADAYGGARKCLDMTVDYAMTREQFGQIIGAFQAVKHQLADLAAEIDPSLALWWYAAHAFDRIREHSERSAAIAKSRLSDVFDRATRVATELHGGIGFTYEFDLHIWFRRAIFDRGFLGEADYHRERAAVLADW